MKRPYYTVFYHDKSGQHTGSMMFRSVSPAAAVRRCKAILKADGVRPQVCTAHLAEQHEQQDRSTDSVFHNGRPVN